LIAATGFGRLRVIRTSGVLVLMLVLAYGIATTLVEYIDSPVLGTVLQLQNFLGDTSTGELTATGRTQLWEDLLSTGQLSLLGTGLGSISGGAWFSNDTGLQTPYTHNDFVLIAQELGWFGLGLFALFGTALCWRTYRAWRFYRSTSGATRWQGHWLPWATAIFFVLLVVRGMLGGFWTDFTAGCYFWLLAGMVAAQPVASETVLHRMGARTTCKKFGENIC